jgi:hypothetical protein
VRKYIEILNVPNATAVAAFSCLKYRARCDRHTATVIVRSAARIAVDAANQSSKSGVFMSPLCINAAAEAACVSNTLNSYKHKRDTSIYFLSVFGRRVRRRTL